MIVLEREWLLGGSEDDPTGKLATSKGDEERDGREMSTVSVEGSGRRSGTNADIPSLSAPIRDVSELMRRGPRHLDEDLSGAAVTSHTGCLYASSNSLCSARKGSGT